MKITSKLINELQRRLKIGNRKGVHLNAIPQQSKYKFDVHRLSAINSDLAPSFLRKLLSEPSFKFKISWIDNVPDLNTLFEEDQIQLVRINKTLENLINQTEAIELEKGINTFGFGYPILVRRDKSDNQLTVAPILIWSLRIRRSKEFNTWEISRREEDAIYINEVLINHLSADAKVVIEQLTSDQLEKGFLSIEEVLDICYRLLRKINSNTPIDLRAVLEQKMQSCAQLHDKVYYEKLVTSYSSSLIEFGGIFSIFEVQKQNIINEYDLLSEYEGLIIGSENVQKDFFQPITSIETDPSQQAVLHSASSTKNILIQGPPGTGKSQTLTALLINALESELKILVVCEKRTALEVLHDSLKEKGLESLSVIIKDIISDRKKIVDSVRDRSVQSSGLRYKQNKESLESKLDQAKSLISVINSGHTKLSADIIQGKNWSALVGDYLSIERSISKDEEVLLNDLNLHYTSQEFKKLLEIVTTAESYQIDKVKIENFSFLNSDKLAAGNPYKIEDDLNNKFNAYQAAYNELHQLIKQCELEFSLHEAELLSETIAKFRAIKHEVELTFSNFQGLMASVKRSHFELRYNQFETEKMDLVERLDALEKLSKEIEHLVSNEQYVLSSKYWVIALFSNRHKKNRRNLIKFQEIYSGLISAKTNSRFHVEFSFANDLIDRIQDLARFRKYLAIREEEIEEVIQLEFSNFNLDRLFEVEVSPYAIDNVQFNYNQGLQEDGISVLMRDALDKFDKFYIGIRDSVLNLNDLMKYRHFEAINRPFKGSIIDLTDEMKFLESGINDFIVVSNDVFKLSFEQLSLQELFDSEGIATAHAFQEKVFSLIDQMEKDDWITEEINFDRHVLFLSKVDELINKKKLFVDDDFETFAKVCQWLTFYNGLFEKQRVLLDRLSSSKNWKLTFLYSYFNQTLRNSADLQLPTDDKEIRALDNVLNNLEREQIAYIQSLWENLQLNAKNEFQEKNKNLSIENLYNYRRSNRFNKLSLRQIVQYDKDLFTTFFPIVFTSPDIASNLFKNMNGYFDIVMFDEASQLRLEDNLPSILKGKRIIIAGDEHQMPPSNFFNKLFDGLVDDEEEIDEEDTVIVDRDNILLSCDSLLDFANELEFEKQYLDFHYRSRHPHLIDFSNYAFYKQRLKPLPESFVYCPIKYFHVNGTFKDHVNEAEAQQVLNIIEYNITRLPNGKYPSVGIATFNVAQRDLIKSKILERQKFSKFEQFNKKIEELEADGLFIKNLENIQGDERDVIIITTTYGPASDGKFAQRFGPLSHSKGYKLLNVIITRAKYKVFLCTSIPEDVIVSYNDYLLVEGSNNRRGVFYAYLAYCRAVSTGDNEMRASILNALAENSNSNGTSSWNRIGELESPFEEEVYDRLVDEFGASKLILQMKVSEFRIDIVYDSQVHGIPKIAIECDGAKYHSSTEAYLYDRHRQKILESHGFVFHRIWSTNWWRNPQLETKRLVDFIRSIEAGPKKKDSDKYELEHAFSDDFDEKEDLATASTYNQRVDDLANIASFDDIPPTNEQFSDCRITIGSVVSLKYLNLGKIVTIRIVNGSVPSKNVDGEQNVTHKSPLALSILEHKVGDIVKVGSLDNYVEIISVSNAST